MTIIIHLDWLRVLVSYNTPRASFPFTGQALSQKAKLFALFHPKAFGSRVRRKLVLVCQASVTPPYDASPG